MQSMHQTPNGPGLSSVVCVAQWYQHQYHRASGPFAPSALGFEEFFQNSSLRILAMQYNEPTGAKEG